MKTHIINKVCQFGLLTPYAVNWYISRFIRQSILSVYFRYLGKYGFSVIGKQVRIDGMPEFIVPCCDIRLGNHVRIGKRCVFQGSSDSTIMIEDHVTINDGAVITSLHGITIGKQTSIGEYTSIRDYNHSFKQREIPIKSQGYEGKPISIGCDVWIGRGCAILAGVTIGDHAVIGANSVVTRDIPEGCIAVGSPAKPIRQR